MQPDDSALLDSPSFGKRSLVSPARGGAARRRTAERAAPTHLGVCGFSRHRAKAIGWFLALTVCVGVAATGHAQTERSLILLTNAWRYHDGLTNPPAAWINVAFDASTWKLGLAAIGAEDATIPVPILSPVAPPSQGGPKTIYSRADFHYPADLGTNGVTLVFSNLIDDGAVFYLNGREIQRLGMPAGAVSYDTFANRTVGDATTFEVFALPASGNIRIGDNVLAVETHDVNATSADRVFAASVTARVPEPIVILEPPPDSVTNAVGTPVTLCVTVTGSDLVYRWFKRTSPVVLGTNACLTLHNPTLNSAGDYYVVVTNALGAVTGPVVRLVMIPDIFPPGLVSAIAQESAPSNTLFVVFTESVLRSTATNPASYRLEKVGTPDSVSISNVAHFQNTVTLRVGGPHWRWGGRYLLTVTGVSDVRGNYLNGLSNRIAVAFPEKVFRMDGISRHFDWVSALVFFPTNLAANWNRPEYDDADPRYWVPVRGVAWYDNYPPPSICGPFGDILQDVVDPPVWPKTYYFRTRFVLPEREGRGAIRLTASIDDGAVFYLNGVEIHRHLMPPGPVGQDTPAVADVEPDVCVQTGYLNVTNLQAGTNLLATEVHQSSDPSSWDVYFGVEIVVLFTPTAQPALQIARTDARPEGLEVTWPVKEFPGWRLVAQSPGETIGTLVATNAPFRTNLVPGLAQFYRLVAP